MLAFQHAGCKFHCINICWLSTRLIEYNPVYPINQSHWKYFCNSNYCEFVNEWIMFQKAKNIDSAFRHIRMFSFIFLVVCSATCIFISFTSYQFLLQAHNVVNSASSGAGYGCWFIWQYQVCSCRQHCF